LRLFSSLTSIYFNLSDRYFQSSQLSSTYGIIQVWDNWHSNLFAPITDLRKRQIAIEAFQRQPQKMKLDLNVASMFSIWSVGLVVCVIIFISEIIHFYIIPSTIFFMKFFLVAIPATLRSTLTLPLTTPLRVTQRKRATKTDSPKFTLSCARNRASLQV